MSKIIVPAHSRREIECCSYYVRERLGIQDMLYVPVLRIVENAIPVFDDEFSCEVVEKSQMENEYASYSPEANLLKIREDVYDDVCRGFPRHRFTIGHELGHYFMHNNVATFSRCSDSQVIPKYMDAEWQANVFASSFLMSPKLIRAMTISEIAEKCGTSYSAAEIAYKNSKKESSSRLNSF